MRFAKLHGAGNDFLVFDGRGLPELAVSLPCLVAQLCHRRLGVGADGVLLLEPLQEGRARVRYWNADGSVAAFCANGTRCAARFVNERWGWPRVVLETGFAPIAAETRGNEVALELPAPSSIEPWRELGVAGGAVSGRYALLGVPHLIVPVTWDDFWQHSIAPLARELRAHPDLPPGGANVTFVHRRGGASLEVRSWERGVEGETLSCGSGVAVAGLVSVAEGWSGSPARLATTSGRTLVVEALGEPPSCPSRLAGPAEWVADGQVSEELLHRGAPPAPVPR